MDGQEKPLEVLKGRFELLGELGQGGQGTTYLGRDRESGCLVAVKELSMRRADSWKAVELFEREGRTLESIDHRAVPDYVDAFHLESEDGSRERFFLVQEFVEGKNFEELMKDGLRMSEAAARQMIREVLEILRDLHGMEPPVIHRDLKPSNMMRREDGSLAIIDFGAVQSLMGDGQSTVAGTTGYMPLEQLTGRAAPASDLFALGATMVHLLSHVHPTEMPLEYMKLQFQEYVNLSPEFIEFLEKLVEPYPKDRFSSAEEVLEALEGLEEGRREQEESIEKADLEEGKEEQPRASTSGSLGARLIVGITLGLFTPCWAFSTFFFVVNTMGGHSDSGLNGMAFFFNVIWFGILAVMLSFRKKKKKGR